MAEAASWTDHALGALAEAGYRRGEARRAVVEALDHGGCALSARDVEAAVRADGRTVGTASVYRTLEQLAELRLVARCDVGEAVARYEVLRPGAEHHHHHMLCDACGRVVPFEDPELEAVLERLARASGPFVVHEHDVVLRGACGGCRG